MNAQRMKIAYNTSLFIDMGNNAHVRLWHVHKVFFETLGIIHHWKVSCPFQNKSSTICIVPLRKAYVMVRIRLRRDYGIWNHNSNIYYRIDVKQICANFSRPIVVFFLNAFNKLPVFMRELFFSISRFASD